MLAQAAVMLAQDATPRSSLGSIVLYALILAVLVAGLIVVALLVRRRLLGQDDTTIDRGTFSLGELRELRDSGKISEAEFDRARQSLVAQQLSNMQQGKDEAGDSDNPNHAPPVP